MVVTAGPYVGGCGQIVMQMPKGREPSGFWVYLVGFGLRLLDEATLDSDDSASV